MHYLWYLVLKKDESGELILHQKEGYCSDKPNFRHLTDQYNSQYSDGGFVDFEVKTAGEN